MSNSYISVNLLFAGKSCLHLYQRNHAYFELTTNLPTPLPIYVFLYGDAYGPSHTKKKPLLLSERKEKRNWLLYSHSTRKVFCYPCMLFETGLHNLFIVGFNDWKHIDLTSRKFF